MIGNCRYCLNRPIRAKHSSQMKLCHACQMRLWRTGSLDYVMGSRLDEHRLAIEKQIRSGKSIYRCAKDYQVPYMTMYDFVRTRKIA